MASSTKKVDKEKNQHIQVYVRLRPANAQEKETGTGIVDLNQNREVLLKERVGNKELCKKFTFDKVFGPTSNQVDLYRVVVHPMIDEVLMGYNCTVFAYGQTGTGKTYTMEGAKSGPLYTWDTDPKSGIIPRSFQHLFEVLGTQELEYNVRVSYLELYNEELFDLLGPYHEMPKLRLYEDSTKKGSVVIQGLSEIIVHNKDEVYNILERGAERKRMAFTQMNDASSRSHTVFSITVHIKESTSEGEDLVKIGKLNLVDLAGSECIGRSGAVDKRAREAGNINQSLLTLGRVITALVEKAPHVPYRESKLTRLLQDSLGGRTKTSIIATISPSSLNSEETASTLEYAHRAKNITNKPELNQKMTKKALIKEYTEEIERLRRDLHATREKNGIYVDEENYNAMRIMLSNQSEALKEKETELKTLKDELKEINDIFVHKEVELKARTQELCESQQNLANTKGQLFRREAALRVTELEREEQKHLVNKQLQTEKVLTAQAENLLQVAEGTTTDLAGLFSKLDRKSSVETQNQTLIKDLERNIKTYVDHMNSELLDTFLHKEEEQLNKHRQAFETQLDVLTQKYKRQMESLDCLRANEAEYILSLEETMLKVTASKKSSMSEIAAVVSHHKECNIQTTRALHDIHRTVMGGLEDMHKHYCEQVENLSNSLRASFQSISSRLSDVEQILGNDVAQLQETMDMCERMEKEKEQYFEQCMASLINYKSTCKKAHGMWKANVSSVHSSLQNVESRSCPEIQASMKGLDECLSEHGQNINALASKKAILSEKTREAMDCLELHERKLTEAHEEQQEKLAVLESRIADALQSISQQAHDHENAMFKEATKHNQELLECHEFNTGFIKNQENQLEQVCIDITDKVRKVSTDVIILKEMMHNFVERELRVDVPTGETPVRKEYTFPRDLVSTAPHQQILQEFRKVMDPSLAMSIDVPESPVKDSEVPEVIPVFRLPPPEFHASDDGIWTQDIKENKVKIKSARPNPQNKQRAIAKPKLLPLRSPNK